MSLMNFTDEELTIHLDAVMDEQNRRQTIAAIPDQIKDLTTKYLSIGGDPAKLP